MATVDVSMLSGIFNDIESSLNTYNGDTATVTADQQKIADLQVKLAADTATQQTDGGSAFSKVAAAIAALQAIQSSLPAPPPPVVTPAPVPPTAPTTPEEPSTPVA